MCKPLSLSHLVHCVHVNMVIVNVNGQKHGVYSG